MAQVKMQRLDPDALRRDRRRSEWRRGAEEKARQDRAARLQALESRQHSIQLALDAYRQLPDMHANVRLRAGGLRIDPPRPLPPSLGGEPWPRGTTRAAVRAYDLRTRRPLSRLVGSKGSALSSYLSMIYTLHAEHSSVDRHPLASKTYPTDVSWATLCGRSSPSLRARGERMNRDVRSIEAAELVRRRPARRGEPKLEFLLEVDPDQPYALPESTATDVIELPSSFFTNGWHLVLTLEELITWLMIVDAYELLKASRPGWETFGVPLTQHVRWSTYGVSGEAYSALHELEEFGLIAVHDPMPTRVKGKFTPPSAEEREAYEEAGHAFSPEPYQLRPLMSGLEKSAIYEVGAALQNSPLPPRMLDAVDALSVFDDEAPDGQSLDVTPPGLDSEPSV